MFNVGDKVRTNKRYENHMKSIFPVSEGFSPLFWKPKQGIVTGKSFLDSIEINGNDSIAECFLEKAE